MNGYLLGLLSLNSHFNACTTWNCFREENAGEHANLPRYRDRAKERREDINPDYDHTSAELGSLHALGPPGTADMRYLNPTILVLHVCKFPSFFVFFPSEGQDSDLHAERQHYPKPILIIVCFGLHFRLTDAHRISIENSKFLGGKSSQLQCRAQRRISMNEVPRKASLSSNVRLFCINSYTLHCR